MESDDAKQDIEMTDMSNDQLPNGVNLNEEIDDVEKYLNERIPPVGDKPTL